VRRLWEQTRSEAVEQIEGIRTRLGDELGHALARLVEGSDSSAWYVAGDKLSRECRRLGGAVFCLNEWGEPDDEHPDRDPDSSANNRVREDLVGAAPDQPQGRRQR
jgi:hypothetical protein